MSAENWAIFGEVEMFRSKSDPTANMEYLWNLENPFGGGDPPPNSLFNLDTLKTLINLGNSLEYDIVGENKDKVYEKDFTLGQDWTNLAVTLGLDDPGQEDPEIGTKRVYLIWLWMQTLWNQTFARKPDGGSFQMGVIGTLGATAFSTEMTTMSLEFPMLTVATRNQINYDASINQGITSGNNYNCS